MGARVQDHEPVFNVPAAVLGVLAVLSLVHFARGFLGGRRGMADLGPRVRTGALRRLRWRPAGRAHGGGDLLPHLHAAARGRDASRLQLGLALAFGGAVARRVGGVRFLGLGLLSGVAGALAFLALNWGLLAPMIGASGAVSGLMGATMRFLFTAIDGGGFRQLRDAPASVPLMPLTATLRDRRVVIATAIWLVVNAAATLGLGAIGSGGDVAWEAHIGGYVAGLLAFGLFDRRPAAAPAGPWDGP